MWTFSADVGFFFPVKPEDVWENTCEVKLRLGADILYCFEIKQTPRYQDFSTSVRNVSPLEYAQIISWRCACLIETDHYKWKDWHVGGGCLNYHCRTVISCIINLSLCPFANCASSDGNFGLHFSKWFSPGCEGCISWMRELTFSSCRTGNSQRALGSEGVVGGRKQEMKKALDRDQLPLIEAWKTKHTHHAS